MSDKQIIERRKEGDSLSAIYEYQNSCNSAIDNMLNLLHVCSVCKKNGNPFTLNEITPIFDKIYSKGLHGGKDAYVSILENLSISGSQLKRMEKGK
jgi:hypothetical protein